MSRPTIRKCYGRNPNTGKAVGERHSWDDSTSGNWGKGRCRFCGRYLEDLFEKPAPPPAAPGSDEHLARAKRSAA